MPTSIDLPEELLLQAEKRAPLDGITLEQLITQAVRGRLGPNKPRMRRLPPGIACASDPPMQPLDPGAN